MRVHILYKRNMSYDQKNYLTVPELEAIPSIVHGFGTMHWTGNDFTRHPELARFQPLLLRQTHSDIVRVVEARPDELLEGDAMITDRPGILLIITTADCLPVFVVDEQKRAIAAVHCGWKGTAKRVLQKTVEAMRLSYGCAPESLVVALGPCIATTCYEVGEDVLTEFVRAGIAEDVFQPHPGRENKYDLDLEKANRIQLTELGVHEENILAIRLCTHCDDNLLSYRRDRKTARRMLNFIGLLSGSI